MNHDTFACHMSEKHVNIMRLADGKRVAHKRGYLGTPMPPVRIRIRTGGPVWILEKTKIL